MILRDGNNGAFEIDDISNNKITRATALGAVGLENQVASFGDFSVNPNETDMMLRNANTGSFAIYDIQHNQAVGASIVGGIGLEFSGPGRRQPTAWLLTTSEKQTSSAEKDRGVFAATRSPDTRPPTLRADTRSRFRRYLAIGAQIGEGPLATRGSRSKPLARMSQKGNNTRSADRGGMAQSRQNGCNQCSDFSHSGSFDIPE
jgi:hypothetical protein